jgi:hypothetical protein
MATVATQLNSGTGFSSGETVTASKLNNLVNTATVTGIVNADINAGADIAGSKLADGAVTNAKVNASAAIAYGKLALTNSIVAGDLTSASVTAAKLDGAQTGSAPIYGCRAWVNFDGTSVTNVGGEDRCAIRASGNVSKVVRTGTGYYRVHFTTAMPDANYSVCGSAKNTSLSGVFYDSGIGIDGIAASDNFTMSLTRGGIVYPTWAGQRINLDTICAQVFR